MTMITDNWGTLDPDWLLSNCVTPSVFAVMASVFGDSVAILTRFVPFPLISPMSPTSSRARFRRNLDDVSGGEAASMLYSMLRLFLAWGERTL